MPDGSKLWGRVYWPMLAILAASALVVVCTPHKSSPPASPLPLSDWDIPRLAAYLNGEGLTLRLIATRKDGLVDDSAFLTTTDKKWGELNLLSKNPQYIGRWRGTLYCEKNPAGADVSRAWGDYTLVAGTFLFYGDPELLSRVRATLTPLVATDE
jgi:hypothetical protein